MNNAKFLAVVDTAYTIYAVASTEHEAKRKALSAAREWVNAQFIADGEPVPYKTNKEVEEYLGCNVYPISEFGVTQEG